MLPISLFLPNEQNHNYDLFIVHACATHLREVRILVISPTLFPAGDDRPPNSFAFFKVKYSVVGLAQSYFCVVLAGEYILNCNGTLYVPAHRA